MGIERAMVPIYDEQGCVTGWALQVVGEIEGGYDPTDPVEMCCYTKIPVCIKRNDLLVGSWNNIGTVPNIGSYLGFNVKDATVWSTNGVDTINFQGFYKNTDEVPEEFGDLITLYVNTSSGGQAFYVRVQADGTIQIDADTGIDYENTCVFFDLYMMKI